MSKLEICFLSGRTTKLDPDKVCFVKEPYQRFDSCGATAEAKMLTAGGTVVNWHAVIYIRLAKEREEEDEDCPEGTEKRTEKGGKR